jgi:polysaccharide export outer membrane protein
VEPAVVASSTRFRKEYILTAGDQIEIVVRGVPEVSRTVVIRPDNVISLPIIDEVPAGGLTPRELDDILTLKFATRLKDPEVTVIANLVRQPVVFVTGDVGSNAATIPFRDAPTAMQAITLAGGFRRSAAMNDVVIIRLLKDGHLVAIRATADAKGQAGPVMLLRAVPLEPDDIIFVPESNRSQVGRFIDDFVNRPLTTVLAITGIYVNFRFIEELAANN